MSDFLCNCFTFCVNPNPAISAMSISFASEAINVPPGFQSLLHDIGKEVSYQSYHDNHCRHGYHVTLVIELTWLPWLLLTIHSAFNVSL